jgi:hypothetical protein
MKGELNRQDAKDAKVLRLGCVQDSDQQLIVGQCSSSLVTLRQTLEFLADPVSDWQAGDQHAVIPVVSGKFRPFRWFPAVSGTFEKNLRGPHLPLATDEHKSTQMGKRIRLLTPPLSLGEERENISCRGLSGWLQPHFVVHCNFKKGQ